MERSEKEQVVAELHEEFSGIQGAVIAQYQGLSVKEITEVRRAFRAEGVTFKVLKNTLARIASEDTPLSVVSEDFVGPIALAYSQEDAIAPARVASKCAKDNDKFELKAGYIDGTRLDLAGIDSLAKLPSKDEMRGKLLNVFMAPATGLVRVMNGVPQKLALALSAYKDKMDGGE
ncbi:MAG TPA: 50S ribosomal protein L10 [Myxococcales bacterium]|nr:50S ribosomal protein L10 [Deltaproteobacteria bacterium]MBU48203.1 50S ribosomal protein L10 [Deltaproteobacteria bacterium]HAA57133.1 50S ribosomal protein L10 [Myxococcales bacterium]|tara:strand:- start:185 stop:709 length:525 start_codon:yes stop_codon:yes gene_type:complete